MRCLLALLFSLALSTPTISFSAVKITEVAWMGVAGESGQFGEWVELYNDGAETNLSGWKLYGDGGTQTIFTLSKTIPAGGYLLIERTTASMTDPVPGVNDEQGSFGGGGLSNDGEDLMLKDAQGNISDSLNYQSGWPAGSVATKETMQKSGSGWVTALATPKAGYSGGGSGNGAGDGNDTPEEVLAVADTTSSGKKAPIPRYTPHIILDVPTEAYQYVEYEFTADIILKDGAHHTKGPIKWNLGDGTEINQKRLEPVRHQYSYPGTYTVWIGYYGDSFAEDPELEISKTIRVGSPAVSVAKIDASAVEITNLSGKSVDLSGWHILSNGTYLKLPDHTTLAADASIVLTSKIFGLTAFGSKVSLARPGKQILKGVQSSFGVQAVKGESVTRAEIGSGEEDVFESGQENNSSNTSEQKRNRTKKIIFGAVALTVLALFILLERFMAKRE